MLATAECFAAWKAALRKRGCWIYSLALVFSPCCAAWQCV